MANLALGQPIRFDYTGNVQSIKLTPGQYLFECYGGSGGGATVSSHTIASSGGLGGYTKAIMEVINEITVYCYVGGAGFYGAGNSSYGGPIGGWNGGGNGGDSISGSGGGATDFRLINGNWNNTNSLKSRFIVAGGGGGADDGTSANTGTVGGSNDGSGGSGGGLIAQGAWIDGSYNSSYGGTQTSGGGFGYGENVTVNTDTGGGGGGWYGGKVTNHNQGGAGGGSSYIKGYSGCDTSYHSNQQGVEYISDGLLQIGDNNGNGYAVITPLLTKYKIITKNCKSNKSNVFGNETVRITVEKDLAINSYPSRFTGYFTCSNDKMFKTGEYKPKRNVIVFKVPEDISEDITIEAIFYKLRVNSNLYKNAKTYEPFDFNKIVGDV